MLRNKYMMANALCISAFIQGAAGEKLSSYSIETFRNDPVVIANAEGFQRALSIASTNLKRHYEMAEVATPDILSVYLTGSVAEWLGSEDIASQAKLLIAAVHQKPSVIDAFTTACDAVEAHAAVAERKQCWGSLRGLYGAMLQSIVSPLINTDEQEYWLPRSVEDQQKGPTYFLGQNINLKLTGEQIKAMRAELPLYFFARHLQRAIDPESDDAFAVLSKETQEEWKGSQS